MTVFVILAVLLTFTAVGLVVWPLLRAIDGAHPVSAILTALVIPAAVLVVYLFASNHDWQPATASGPAAATAATASVEEAVASLEKRLSEAPEDEEGWILLGSSYLSLSRPADAGTVAGIAPPVVPTIGRPWASASA